MSGKDERGNNRIDICPKCKHEVLVWYIISSFLQEGKALFNCTDRYGGPDYKLDGSFDNIICFQCSMCRQYFAPETPLFSSLMRSMNNTCHVRDNPRRRGQYSEW